MQKKFNLSIKQLYLLIFITAASLIGLGIYGINDYKKLNDDNRTLYADRVVCMRQLTNVRFQFATEITPAALNVKNHLLTFGQAEQRIRGARLVIDSNWNNYKLTYLTSEENLLARQTDSLKKIADEETSYLQAVLLKKDTAALDELIKKQAAVKQAPFLINLTRLMDLQQKVGRQIFENSSHTYTDVSKNFALWIVVTLVVGLSLSFLIIKNTGRLIKDILESHDSIVKAERELTISGQNLANYNRELTLLNTINDVILRAGDEQRLYQEACDCLVAAGNYRLAWICLKPGEHDIDQTISPLVAAGATDFLAEIKIDLNDPQLSNGPTAMTLISEKTIVNNDAAHSSFFTEWLNRAAEFEIRASIALPLSFGDHKSGALIIYAGEVNAFDTHEIVVLERLAANLSIAVRNIQNRRTVVESENKFRGAFQDSAIGMGLVSVEGKWLEVNRPLCDMLGYTEQELLSLDFQQITFPDDLEKDVESLNQMLDGNADFYRVEKRYIHRGGSIVWVNLNVSVVRGTEKRALYFVVQVENITEKIESQTKFQNLVENSVVGVYILQHNKFVYVNPRIIKDSGYTEEEIIGMPFERFIYSDDLKLVSDMIDIRTKKEIGSVRYEVRLMPKDGNPVWYEILGGSTIYHGAPALIGTMVNISERKAALDELMRSEANLKSIFDTTDVSYLLLDTSYNIVALNQHMKNIYIKMADVVLEQGKNLFDLMLPEKRENARKTYDAVIKNNQSIDYETSYVSNGISTHLLANVKPIHNGHEVMGVCISSIDITERNVAMERLRELNNHLEKQAEKLEYSNAELEQFAYVASHDLQEPLRMVTSFLAQLEKKYAGVLDDKAKQYIYFATDGAKRMRQLILDLLEYSRVGRTENNLENVDLNELVQDVLMLFRRNIEETNAIVQFKDLPKFNIYKTPVRQIFHNLIGNALKYQKPGAVPLIEISCSETRSVFEFVVKDNGIGIDPEFFDQIFIIFKRLHNREEYTGTGMGLAITKKIVERLRGKIWVTSKEEEGSTFHFTLPKHIKT